MLMFARTVASETPPKLYSCVRPVIGILTRVQPVDVEKVFPYGPFPAWDVLFIWTRRVAARLVLTMKFKPLKYEVVLAPPNDVWQPKPSAPVAVWLVPATDKLYPL